MSEVHKAAAGKLARLLVANLVLDPLGAGLTAEELRTAALQLGMSSAIFGEIIEDFWTERAKAGAERVTLSPLDLVMLMEHGAFPSVLPMATIPRLDAAFIRLEERYGVKTPKPLQAILAECSDPEGDIKLALAILALHKNVEREGDGFCRRRAFAGMGKSDAAHPASEELKRAIATVQPILASRGGVTHPAVNPIEQFHEFLEKRGLKGLAGWWADKASELSGVGDFNPTASTVLAGAMLEAALIAIAEPAQRAGQWTQRFLKDKPTQWSLKELIDQAEVARTFSPNEAAHARTVAERRNRIHPGRFVVEGPDRFRPPRTNAHEAQLAKLHLDLLLTRILDWEPISELL